MNDSDAQMVAAKVRRYIQNRPPGGVTLEVIEEGVRKVDNWWRVPVRPGAWPANRCEYYDALAEIEDEIQENENLDILIATAEPAESPSVA